MNMNIFNVEKYRQGMERAKQIIAGIIIAIIATVIIIGGIEIASFSYGMGEIVFGTVLLLTLFLIEPIGWIVLFLGAVLIRGAPL